MIFRFKGNGNERIVDNCPQWRTPCGILCSYPQSPTGASGLVPVGAVFKAPLKTLLNLFSDDAMLPLFRRFKSQLPVHRPAVGGTLHLARLAARGPLRTPKRTRRSPLHRFVRTLPMGRLHFELPLSRRFIRTLPIGRLHCAPLTVCAGSRGGFSPQSCFADVFRPGIHASL